MSDSSSIKVAVDVRADLLVVNIQGRVVRENLHELRNQLEDPMRDGGSLVALDLSGVDYMDSGGLGCCAAIHKLLSEQGSGAVAAFGASADLESTWNLIRLDKVIPIFANEDDAIAWLHMPR